MAHINRRTFLGASGASALGSFLHLDAADAQDVASPAVSGGKSGKVIHALDWSTDELTFSFDLLDGRLRSKTLLPKGSDALIAAPAATDLSGVEVAIHCSGENYADHHGFKSSSGSPAFRLIFQGKVEQKTATGKRLTLTHVDPILHLRVESFYESFLGVPVVRRWARVTNMSDIAVGIEYLSSAMLYNFSDPQAFEQDLMVHFAYNTWMSEGQWQAVRPSQLGFFENNRYSLSGVSMDNIGTWSSERYLPIGIVENTRLHLTWFWQIEHNGSWHWELANTNATALYAYIGGPDALHGQAWKNLRPSESYESVPVAIGCVRGGLQEAIEALTLYRRTTCVRNRPSKPNCPVVYNDYMNSIVADPTTAKEWPLIDAAAEAGCEYFVIDAGWHAELGEHWWGGVGLWEESKTRWPGGLIKVLNYIRNRGMKVGLWLEPEVVGVRSPLASKPEDWFFQRHGKRIVDNSRLLLDLRNMEVRTHLDAVVDRLMRDYRLDYIKLDYNVEGLAGTEARADSFGQGLLEHNRALLTWLDGVLTRYPNLIVENCASGGGRMDYAMLSHLQLESVSDQENYRKIPAVLVGSTAAVLPEQLASWSYPVSTDDADATCFNMVNAMIVCIFQSGQLASLSTECFLQVKTAITIYKQTMRQHIPHSVPFYPLGMPAIADEESAVALGLRTPAKTFVAVWRLKGHASVQLSNIGRTMHLIYPIGRGIQIVSNGGGTTVTFPREYVACILASA